MKKGNSCNFSKAFSTFSNEEESSTSVSPSQKDDLNLKNKGYSFEKSNNFIRKDEYFKNNNSSHINGCNNIFNYFYGDINNGIKNNGLSMAMQYYQVTQSNESNNLKSFDLLDNL